MDSTDSTDSTFSMYSEWIRVAEYIEDNSVLCGLSFVMRNAQGYRHADFFCTVNIFS